MKNMHKSLPSWHPLRKQLERQFAIQTRRAPSSPTPTMKDVGARILPQPDLDLVAQLYTNALSAAGVTLSQHWVEIPQTMTSEMKRAAAQTLTPPNIDLACHIFYSMLRAAR